MIEEHEKQFGEYDEHGQEVTPPPPSVPPTMPGEIKAYKKPIWPTVIAVIGFVVCALGVWGVINLEIPWAAYVFSDSAFTQSQLAQLWRFMIPQALVQLFGLGLMVYLLLACIRLVKRQPVAAGMLRRFALIEIPYSIFAMSLDTVAHIMRVGEVFHTTELPPDCIVLIMLDLSVNIFYVRLAFALAYPVFLLVWFRRNVVKEQIATWNA